MAFLRIKRIRGKEYAYLVENEWKRKSSRQQVKDYLGRVYRFDLRNDIDFSQFIKGVDIKDYISKNGKNEVVKDLIEWELFKFGINKQEFSLDLDNKKFQKGNKNIVIFVNDGFMCSYTLRNLIEFTPEGDEELDGFRFAKAFVDAGVKVPRDVFVGLCQKLFSF